MKDSTELKDVMDSSTSSCSRKSGNRLMKLETTVYVLFSFLLGMLLTHIILHAF